jgi:hypothetical protein
MATPSEFVFEVILGRAVADRHSKPASSPGGAPMVLAMPTRRARGRRGVRSGGWGDARPVGTGATDGPRPAADAETAGG